ncbi:hypothetical protein [Leptolyngbya sp. FACHB-261]|uniref:hypothetical protein n=1 Tax=Leptolyngbya sp. FACHB-261 TaxID=2692806 RepID=UPI0016844A24|nr:hypothetical protein [Leptolyngbya sp. FACHB-261]MBD2101209.1 hypothetical protein [Leptolyngbya sp. FACHB-261]
MLHLAQVQKKGFLGKTELRLLAFERNEHTWVVLIEEEFVTASDVNFPENMLVLVEVNSNRQVQNVRDAGKWVLDLLQRHMAPGVNSASLEEEFKVVEGWRQSLTLQSQEFSRRQLEIEARREQLQLLEDTLSRREKELEASWNKLRTEQERLNRSR